MGFVIAGAVFLSIVIGWLARVLYDAVRADPLGILNVVEWNDGTTELLLQLDEGPEKFENGHLIMLRIHKTRK